jgi:hypothetical protein
LASSKGKLQWPLLAEQVLRLPWTLRTAALTEDISVLPSHRRLSGQPLLAPDKSDLAVASSDLDQMPLL